MNISFFSKLYSYKERENKNSQENYLIEIFAFCLEIDDIFRKNFFKLLQLDKIKDEVRIQTQSVYELGRPDIEIKTKKTNTLSVLIECKIDHFERENQLNDYVRILECKDSKNKTLVYITKNYEEKPLVTKSINFIQIRWLNVFQLINDECNLITLELANYLIDNNMSNSNNFTFQDLSSLLSISDAIAKMDETLDSIKPYFEMKIGILSKQSARSTRLKENFYINYHDCSNGKIFSHSIQVGFYWWDENPSIAIRFYLSSKDSNKNYSKIKELLDKELPEWETEDWGDAIDYWYYKSISEFICKDEEQQVEINKYLKIGIDILSTIIKNNKTLFK